MGERICHNSSKSGWKTTPKSTKVENHGSYELKIISIHTFGISIIQHYLHLAARMVFSSIFLVRTADIYLKIVVLLRNYHKYLAFQ